VQRRLFGCVNGKRSRVVVDLRQPTVGWPLLVSEMLFESTDQYFRGCPIASWPSNIEKDSDTE
jgi:hypothetical protein